MNLPQHSTLFEAYSSLLFVPAGRKYPSVRSVGHKEEKALLSRIEQIVSEELQEYTEEDKLSLQAFLGTDEPRLPVPIYKKEQLYPLLIKPEMFLWKKHSSQRGIPLTEAYFYKKEYSGLSSKELQQHLQEVVQDYFFSALLHERSRENWLQLIENAYKQHPFIMLAESKKNVVKNVESMNKSSLLAVMKYPEDVAFWRHRVEIVMRPYRSIPTAWHWEICNHEKKLTMQAAEKSILCTCPICHFSITYDIKNDIVLLPNEVNIEQAAKRIVTIERQLNEMADRSISIVQTLQDLQQLKIALIPYSNSIREIMEMQGEQSSSDEVHPIITCYAALKKMIFPEQAVEPTLLSLAEVDVPDLSVFKKANKWKLASEGNLKEKLSELKAHLQQTIDSNKPQEDEVILQIKNYSLIRKDLERIQQFSEEAENITRQLLFQVLKGEATSKIRNLGHHHHDIFALLKDWPAKSITKSIMELEQRNLLKK